MATLSFGRIWARVPTLLRGAVVAIVILVLGQLPPGLFLIANLEVTPAVPWFLAATVAWLWCFWSYLNGRWWPAVTGKARAENLRGSPLSLRVWSWSLVAGGFGMISVLSGALLTGLIANLPREALEPPFDLGPYPGWTVAAFFLNIALVAGVVEETAFRGYMLSIVERRHGWVVAIGSVAILFYVVHLSHAYATLAFIPFFIAYSVLHGLLVFLTRSILPSVVLHALGDLAILPVQYGAVANPLGQSLSLHVLVVVLFGVTATAGLLRLAAATRGSRLEVA